MSDLLDPRWLGASIPIDHWHFHRRLLSRYGIVLAPGEFSAMCRDIRTGRAPVVERRRRGVALYAVRLRDTRARVYVAATGSRILTAWPPSKRLNARRRPLLAAERALAGVTGPEQSPGRPEAS